MIAIEKEIIGADPETGKPIIRAFIVASETPAELPTDGSTVDNLADDEKLGVFSILYVVADSSVYIANEEGEFVLQSSGGGGGGGDGCPMYEVLNMASVPLVKDPDAPYHCVASFDLDSQVGWGDLLLIEIGGDANVTLTGFMNGFGTMFIYPDIFNINGTAVWPGFSYDAVSIAFEGEEAPFIPNISMKITRLGDSSGKQPWSDGGDGSIS